MKKVLELLKIVAPALNIDINEVNYDNAEFDERLDLKPIGIKNGNFEVEINGMLYGYKPDTEVFGGDINQLEKDFLYKIAHFGAGKALAWLKKVTILTLRPSGPVGATPGVNAKVLHQYKIPSSSGTGEYEVNNYDDNTWSCTCPHHVHRGAECKHIAQAKSQSQTQPSKVAASLTGK